MHLYHIQANGISVTNEELEGLMHVYDRNFNGKISYDQFIRELSPKKSSRK